MIVNNFEVGKFIAEAKHQPWLVDMSCVSNYYFYLQFLQPDLQLQTWETDAFEARTFLEVRTFSSIVHSIVGKAPLFDTYPGP